MLYINVIVQSYASNTNAYLKQIFREVSCIKDVYLQYWIIIKFLGLEISIWCVYLYNIHKIVCLTHRNQENGITEIPSQPSLEACMQAQLHIDICVCWINWQKTLVQFTIFFNIKRHTHLMKQLCFVDDFLLSDLQCFSDMIILRVRSRFLFGI